MKVINQGTLSGCWWGYQEGRIQCSEEISATGIRYNLMSIIGIGFKIAKYLSVYPKRIFVIVARVLEVTQRRAMSEY